MSAAQLLSGRQINTSVETEVLAEVELFDDIWKLGLALFGCHLLLIGWLAFTSGLVPRFVGVLVAIAGLGYLIDNLAGLLSMSYGFELASFTFIGEVLLMVWLLMFAFRENLVTAQVIDSERKRRSVIAAQEVDLEIGERASFDAGANIVDQPYDEPLVVNGAQR